MRTSAIALGIAAALASGSASAWETTLLDTNTPAREQTITSKQLGIKAASPFSIKVQLLHGGRQEGVMLVTIDTGAMKITVVPNRGMNVAQAVSGEVRLGWKSPVREIVNPAFLDGVVCGRGRNPTLRLWPAIFSGEIDVFPSERRNMGQEIGR